MPLFQCALLLMVAAAAAAQTPTAEQVQTQVRRHRSAHELAILNELRELLAVPNVASNKDDILRNARLLEAMLQKRGVRTRLLQAGDSPVSVYGELNAPGATRTVVFYAHFDGQPVDPQQWSTPPWQPTMRDQAVHDGGRVVPWDQVRAPVPGQWRIYARSASDDKSPIVAMLAALDALRAANIPLSVNLKFFLDGEEEAGSPHLPQVVKQNAELLRADLWIFGDGPMHQSGRQQITFGVRGAYDLEITTYGPARPLHSGHYGNWAPNPAAELANLLAGMRDSEGRILVEGFYEAVRPLSASEKRALEQLPANEAELQQTFALGRSENVRARLVEAITLPALNVRGIRAADVGQQATNAIPARAQASIDIRLVPELTPAKATELIEAHLRRQGYHIVHSEPDAATRRRHPRLVKLDWGAGYPGHRTSMDLPASQALIRVLEEHVGAPILKLPNSGGSLPIYVIAETLDVPLIVVPMVNFDNNQHAPDENLRVQNLWDGIETYASLLARLGAAWK